MRSQRVRFYEQKWIRFRERRGLCIVNPFRAGILSSWCSLYAENLHPSD
jgi:hypothetical protein